MGSLLYTFYSMSSRRLNYSTMCLMSYFLLPCSEDVSVSIIIASISSIYATGPKAGRTITVWPHSLAVTKEQNYRMKRRHPRMTALQCYVNVIISKIIITRAFHSSSCSVRMELASLLWEQSNYSVVNPNCGDIRWRNVKIYVAD